MNLRNLERVLAREEEVKKRAIVHKQVYTGPQLRYYSKDGKLSEFVLLIGIETIASVHLHFDLCAISFSDRKIYKLYFF